MIKVRRINFFLRLEPVSVAKDLDQLLLGVIGLSNLTTAGFRRNIFKYSDRICLIFVERQPQIKATS